MVHDQSAPAPTSNRYTDSRFDDRRSGVLRVRPEHLCLLRLGDAHSRVSDTVKLLRSKASTLLGGIRHLVSATVFLQSLVAALVLCRLDYGNGTLVGLPALAGIPCLPGTPVALPCPIHLFVRIGPVVFILYIGSHDKKKRRD